MGRNGEEVPQKWKNYVTIYFHSDQVVTYICIRAGNWKLFFAQIPCLRSQVVVLATHSFWLNHNGDKCSIKTQLSGYKANLHIRKPLANIKVIQVACSGFPKNCPVELFRIFCKVWGRYSKGKPSMGHLVSSLDRLAGFKLAKNGQNGQKSTSHPPT